MSSSPCSTKRPIEYRKTILPVGGAARRARRRVGPRFADARRHLFPEVLPHPEGVVLYNYTSDPEGPDVTWIEGQLAPTQIDRVVVRFREATR